MDAGNPRARKSAAAHRHAAGTDRARRAAVRAAAYAVEGLERRVLLAAIPAADDFLDRLRNHALPPAELEARDWMSLEWRGQRIYAKDNEWLVRLDLDRAGGADARGVIHGLGVGATVKRTVVGDDELALVQVPDGIGYGALVNALSGRGLFERAEPNGILWAQATPNDPMYGSQWGLNNTGQTGGTSDADIDAPAAWDLTTGSSVVVAVVDSGVQYNHPDLAANMWTNPGEVAGNGVDDDGNGFIDDVRGADFVNADGDPMDDFFHGTHVAGIIGAKGNNAVGVSGVAWNVRLMALKMLDGWGNGTWEGAAAAINYVSDMHDRGVNVRVTNNSYAGYSTSFELETAIQGNADRGILFVAAAANDSNDNDQWPAYPASYPQANVVSVAATDHNDQLAWFSNYGLNSVDLAAPGVDILNTMPTTVTPAMSAYGIAPNYDAIDGTSMASPHVAGIAALAFSLTPSAAMLAVKQAIFQGADRVNALHGITVFGARANARGTLDLIRTPRTVNGTSGNDTISVQPTSGVPGSIDIVLNGVVQYSGSTSTVSWLRLFGNDGNDTITVNTALAIPVWAEGGNGGDVITGGAGGDVLYGGEGNDTLNGGAGNDRLDGGNGFDRLRGDGGNNDLAGGAGGDTYVFNSGVLGVDAITNEASNIDGDTLDFTAFSMGVIPNIAVAGTRAGGTASVVNANLTLYIAGDGTQIENVLGSNFADTLSGNSRNNYLNGQGGSDWLDAGAAPEGSDQYYGGTYSYGDIDTVDYDQRVNNLTLTLDNTSNDGESGENDNIYSDVEAIRGGWGNDIITGGSNNDRLYGMAGSDTVSGGYGGDSLEGNDGNDVLYGEYSNYDGQGAGDTVRGGEGDDWAYGGYGNDFVYGDGGNDNIYGGWHEDSLSGGNGNDNLFGYYGNDTLVGDQGFDQHYGEEGNDSFNTKDPFFPEFDRANGGNGVDTVINSDPEDELINM